MKISVRFDVGEPFKKGSQYWEISADGEKAVDWQEIYRLYLLAKKAEIENLMESQVI
jgi:hypothetical protein